MGMKVGYARVSTVGPKLDVQRDYLADCDRIFREKASASSTKNRPELKNALDFIMSTEKRCLHKHKRPPDVDPVALILRIKELPEYLYQ